MSVLEAEKVGSLAFFTLTYDDGNLPLMASKLKKYHYCEYDSKKDIFTEREDFEILHQHIVDYRNPDWSHDYVVHPSLCREHVQMLLKRYRQDYFRRFGSRVDLRFSLFGEYGSRTHRPHYHLIVYGLDKSECVRLRNMWQFGFTDMRYITHFNSDGSDAFVKVSRYVSKYLAKGSYLPDYVKDGLAEKPRRQSSLRFGLRDLDVDRMRFFI